MSESQVQDEEREVLSSIYEGDENFKEVSPNTFEYKYGEQDSVKSFVLEIKWGDEYPNELPVVDMDVFYNKHIVDSLKEKIVNLVLSEAEQYLGMSMTYSLFELVKEHFDDVISEQPETLSDNIGKLVISETGKQEAGKKSVKKEALTKAQKRRQWQRLDGKGEKKAGIG